MSYFLYSFYFCQMTKFQLPAYPRSGSKVMSVEEEERRAKVNDYNGQYLSPEPKFYQIPVFCFGKDWKIVINVNDVHNNICCCLQLVGSSFLSNNL